MEKKDKIELDYKKLRVSPLTRKVYFYDFKYLDKQEDISYHSDLLSFQISYQDWKLMIKTDPIKALHGLKVEGEGNSLKIGMGRLDVKYIQLDYSGLLDKAFLKESYTEDKQYLDFTAEGLKFTSNNQQFSFRNSTLLKFLKYEKINFGLTYKPIDNIIDFKNFEVKNELLDFTMNMMVFLDNNDNIFKIGFVKRINLIYYLDSSIESFTIPIAKMNNINVQDWWLKSRLEADLIFDKREFLDVAKSKIDLQSKLKVGKIKMDLSPVISKLLLSFFKGEIKYEEIRKFKDLECELRQKNDKLELDIQNLDTKLFNLNVDMSLISDKWQFSNGDIEKLRFEFSDVEDKIVPFFHLLPDANIYKKKIYKGNVIYFFEYEGNIRDPKLIK